MPKSRQRIAPTPPVLIPIADAAPLVPCSPFSLATPGWRLRHRIPHYKLGGRIMFSVDELAEWRKGCRVDNGTAA